jgi:hypothetical protein
MTGPSGEEVRTARTVGMPDPRTGSFMIRSGPDDAWRAVTIDDGCRAAASLQLSSTVEEDVRHQFALACNLFIYSWHVYRFHAVSQLQAFRTLELALRRRVPAARRAKGMKDLIDGAIAAGLLLPADFAPPLGTGTWASTLTDAQRASAGKPPLDAWKHTAEFIRMFRNDLAHGEPWLLPNSLDLLRLVGTLLNALYRAP